MTDGLKGHTVPLPLGGAKNAVFFLHRTVEWVFGLDEQQTRGVKISISSFFCVPAEPRCRKGDADKILDQIRLQEVPHVHL